MAATKANASKDNMLYMAAGVVVILVIIGLALLYVGVSSSRPTLNGQNQTTVSTINSSTQHLGNVTCPCLSSVQIQTMMNESASQTQMGVYNTTYTQNANSPGYLQVNYSGIGQGWKATYQIANQSEAAGEIVVQSQNSSGLYNYTTQLASSFYNTSFTNGGQVNGFTYSYLKLSGPIQNSQGVNQTVTLYVLYGYKGGYNVGFSFITPNNGVASFSTIAAEIAPTV